MATKKEVLEFLRKNPDALKDEFKIQSRKPTKLKTFEVEEELLEQFVEKARDKKLKIKEAVDQAFRAWIGRG